MVPSIRLAVEDEVKKYISRSFTRPPDDVEVKTIIEIALLGAKVASDICSMTLAAARLQAKAEVQAELDRLSSMIPVIKPSGLPNFKPKQPSLRKLNPSKGVLAARCPLVGEDETLVAATM